MDTLYIQMCDCPEIQENSPKPYDEPMLEAVAGNHPLFVFTQDFFAEIHDGGERRTVWLPTQSQLQEMVGDMDKCLEMIYWWKEAGRIGDCYEYDTYSFTTMEQLWLAFVMWELHKKKWVDNKWVKEAA